MTRLRKSIVSGQFYPKDQKDLVEAIERFQPKENNKISAKGLILPHAGYVYSGEVAIATVARTLPKKHLLLLGPNHTGLGADFALDDQGEWETPLGNISINVELALSILKPGGLIQADETAHLYEHSLEVQLPIFRHFFGEFSFVPIACKPASQEICGMIADQIIQGIKYFKKEILLVASTDLTHYESDSTARAKDRIVIEAIVNLDDETLIKEVNKNQITMCGLTPVAILIRCLKELRARKAQVCRYQTSGDSSGDYSSVVGYVGMLIK